MTEEEITIAIKYFKSIKSKCLIEAEVKQSDSASFIVKYKAYKHCSAIDPSHLHIIPDGDKWGVELRIYYVADDNTPKFVLDKSTKNNRGGFEQYNKRLNNNTIIYKLFENGFCIG